MKFKIFDGECPSNPYTHKHEYGYPYIKKVPSNLSMPIEWAKSCYLCGHTSSISYLELFTPEPDKGVE